MDTITRATSANARSYQNSSNKFENEKIPERIDWVAAPDKASLYWIKL